MTYEEQMVDVKNKKRGVIEQRPRCKKKVGKKLYAVRFHRDGVPCMARNYKTKRDAEKALAAYQKHFFWSRFFTFKLEINT